MLGNPALPWGNDFFSGWLFSLWKFFLLCSTGISPGITCLCLIFSMWLLVQREYLLCSHPLNTGTCWWGVFPNSSFLKAEQTQLSQPFLTQQVSQSLDHLCGPSLHPLWVPTPLFDVGTKTEHTIPRVAWQVLSGMMILSSLPCWCSSAHPVLSLSRGTELTHPELAASQVPSHRAAPQLGWSQPLLHSWGMFSQVQDLTLALAGLHKVLASTSFQPIQVFLQGVSAFQSVQFPTHWQILLGYTQSRSGICC